MFDGFIFIASHVFCVYGFRNIKTRKNGLKVKTVHSADDLMLYVSLRIDSKASYKRK